YTVSMMTKTDSEAGSSPTMFVHYFDEHRNSLQRFNSWRNVGTEWTEFSFTTIAPGEAKYVSITLFSDTLGIRSLYFDDIVLKNAEGEVLPIINAGFEQQYIANDNANTLVEYVQKSTGIELPVITQTG